MESSSSSSTSSSSALQNTIIVLLILIICVATKCQNYLLSLWETDWVVAYGIHSSFRELLFHHCWFLCRALFVHEKHRQRARKRVIEQIKAKFLAMLHHDDTAQVKDHHDEKVVITHSCRTIFYCLIQSLLDAKDTKHIKICSASMHFGSFYRLLRSIELAQKCTIEHYEIDLCAHDFTLNALNTSDIDETSLSECDLILCQHFFGVPFEQNLLFQLGRKYDIPILEDCVQTGSLYGEYRGHQLADVMIWSCGLDKTPSCFGGGLGYFCNTKHGQALYEKVRNMTDGFQVDSLRDRAVSLLNQAIHLIFTRNHACAATLVAIIGHLVYYRNEAYTKYYELALKVRTNKSITPFQHQSSLFLTQPSIAQLDSILYGLRKNYDAVSGNELRKHALFLENIPSQFHSALFPWITEKTLSAYADNKGIGEFTWVYSKSGDRVELNEFLSEHLVITTINTTWVHHSASTLKENNAQFICENLTYLPNIHEMNDRQIVKLAKILTAYCEYKKF